MRHAIRGPFGIVFLLLTACSGEPFQLADPPVDERPPPGASARAELPERPKRARQPVKLAGLGLAAAARGPHRVVVLEVATGVTLGEHAFAGVVVDLAWQATTRRLLVVEADPGQDHCRVRGCALGDRELVCRWSSPPFSPDGRVLALGADRALLMTRELGTSWSALDSDLAPLAPGQLVAEPKAIVKMGDSAPGEVLSLSRASDGESERDELHLARWDGAWQLQTAAHSVLGTPDSRLAGSPAGDELWFVRKWGAVPRLAIGALGSAPLSAAPSLQHVAVPGATGLLEEAVFDAEQRAVVALLSRGDDASELVAIGVDAGEGSSVLALPGAVERGVWLGHRLAVSQAGFALVASSSGLSIHRSIGTRGAPGFASQPALTLDLDPPVVALD